MSWWDDADGDETDEDEPYGQYESKVRIRPNPKANRPRTKVRPSYDDAPVGWVTNVDRGRFGVLVTDADGVETVITATKARELGKKSVVTGDHVSLVGDLSGEPGSLARIVKVAERTTLLRRSADDTDEVERVIVANADQMVIVVAAADPEPRPRLIDRYLVAAFAPFDAGLDPVLCITKTDLADPAPFLAHFACLDLRIVTSRSDDVPYEALHEVLDGKVSVTVGHSGVGKSTLVNAITGSTRATGSSTR